MLTSRIFAAILAVAVMPRAADAAAFTVLHTFGEGPTDGAYPKSPLLLKDHRLYGTTNASGGGNYNGGTIFQIDPVTGVQTTLATLIGSTGGMLNGRLVYRATDNALYGTGTGGGAYDVGVVFRLDLTTGAESTVHSFSTHDGTYAVGGLIAPSNSAFYGVTGAGGLGNGGTIFKFIPDTSKIRVLYNFGYPDGSNGVQPAFGGLLYYQGYLYGATYGGGLGFGVIFRCDPITGSLLVLHRFTDNPDGAYPQSDLTEFGGALYGTTTQGGAYSVGTAYKIDLTTNALTILHSFQGKPDGGNPSAGLTVHNGTLYGTTTDGGKYQSGTIFNIDPSTNATTSIYDFRGLRDGSESFSDLTSTPFALYGTTYTEGRGNAGTVFKFVP